MNLFYRISIDHVNANYISGWCFHRFNANEIIELQCFIGNDLVATARADRFREDLQSLGIHPSGRCGFEFVIKSSPTNLATICTIKIKRTSGVVATIDTKTNQVRYSKRWPGPLFKRTLKRSNRNGLVVFMHIPKTAGTSFNTLAQQLFGKRSVRTHIELVEPGMYQDIAAANRYISGHLRFKELDTYFDSGENDFYTILREPYAQLHSHLKWLIQTASDTRDTFFKHNNPVIYRLGQELAGIHSFAPETLGEMVDRMRSIEAAFLDNSQTRYFLDATPDRVSGSDMVQAQKNISMFKHIGTTENYDLFIRIFCQLNSLTVPTRHAQMNRSKSDDLFDYRDKQIREILRPLVCYDQELYDSVID